MAAWQACRTYCGHAPSASEYSGWRESEEAKDIGASALPHEHTLTKRLGGGWWSGVARALCSHDLPRARRSRPGYTKEELVAAWRACRSSLGHIPTQAEYDAWTETDAASTVASSLPASQTLLRRLGGGFWSGVGEALREPSPRCQEIAEGGERPG